MRNQLEKSPFIAIFSGGQFELSYLHFAPLHPNIQAISFRLKISGQFD